MNPDFAHPADGWYNIEPMGRHRNMKDVEGGVIQLIDAKAVSDIVKNFNAQADDPQFAGMLIDHEHFKFDQSKETIAYGWLMKLQARQDGVYGQIRWTSTGQAAVDGGDYRFFSTEYYPTSCNWLNHDKPALIRPFKLDGLTLTNSPNNKGGKPITNRKQQIHPFTTQLSMLCRVYDIRANISQKTSFQSATWH